MLCRLLFCILDNVSKVLGRPASQVTVVGVTLRCSTEPTSSLGVGQFSSFTGRPQRHSQDRRRGEHRGGWQSWGLRALLLVPTRNGWAHGRSASDVAWDRGSAGCCVDALPGALSKASPSPAPGRIRHSGAFYGVCRGRPWLCIPHKEH
uniref:Secreted protein n=1 Tax=Cercocebus atys TaxID=9531 RepID=A0A2K5NPT8_CERAT